jgi:hypothetical protein
VCRLLVYRLLLCDYRNFFLNRFFDDGCLFLYRLGFVFFFLFAFKAAFGQVDLVALDLGNFIPLELLL